MIFPIRSALISWCKSSDIFMLPSKIYLSAQIIQYIKANATAPITTIFGLIPMVVLSSKTTSSFLIMSCSDPFHNSDMLLLLKYSNCLSLNELTKSITVLFNNIRFSASSLFLASTYSFSYSSAISTAFFSAYVISTTFSAGFFSAL